MPKRKRKKLGQFSGATLRAKRLEAGVKQYELAEALAKHGAEPVSRHTIRNWESPGHASQPRADQLRAIGLVLDCDITEFYEEG